MESAVNNDQNQGVPLRRVTRRKPKDGNSELFNELLSGANALSVSERTRLIKSLAGQLNMVVVGSGELLAKAEPKAKKSVGVVQPTVAVRPNPLKGTKFELDKDAAYKALVEAKREARGAKLPADHVAVVRYAAALADYKSEHKRLAPVAGPATAPAAKPKAKARTANERSPEPPQAPRTGSGVLGRLSNAAASVKKMARSKGTDQMETEDVL